MATRSAIARSAPYAGDGESHVGLQRTTLSQRTLYHPSGCLSFEYDAAGSSKIQGEWETFDAAFAGAVLGIIALGLELLSNVVA